MHTQLSRQIEEGFPSSSSIFSIFGYNITFDYEWKKNWCVPVGTQRVEAEGMIRTSVCITPPRLLAHDGINYGVLICAFYGNVTPRRSKHKLYLE
jgi:hypothetical protein